MRYLALFFMCDIRKCHFIMS